MSWRQQLLPTVDALLEPAGLYAAYELDPAEFIGRAEYLPLGQHDAAEVLLESGYESSTLAALKYHPDTGDADVGSFRRVDEDHPRWQWHVHLFDVDGAVEIFSHYELRPDLDPIGDETVAERYERIREHYRPTWGMEKRDEVTYVLGACDTVVAGLLDVEAGPDRK